MIISQSKNEYNKAMELLLWLCLLFFTSGFGALVMLLVYLFNHKIRIHL